MAMTLAEFRINTHRRQKILRQLDECDETARTLDRAVMDDHLRAAMLAGIEDRRGVILTDLHTFYDVRD